MTNKDRLISLIGFQPSSNSIDGVLKDAGITGSSTYDSTNASGLKRCAIQLIELLFSSPDQVNENGFSTRYDRAALEKLVRRYQIELGDIKEGSYLKDKSYLLG